MKIYLKGTWVELLERRFKEEGDEIVKNSKEADLILEDGEKIGNEVLECIFSQVSKEPEFFRLIRWFDYLKEDFRTQTIVGLPVLGILNKNNGAQEETGICCRYVQKSPVFFDNLLLKGLLKEMKYSGLVSLSITKDNKIRGLNLSGELSLLCLVEGIKGKLGEYISDPSVHSLESWTCSLLLTSFPYPYNSSEKNLPSIKVEKDAVRHVWEFKNPYPNSKRAVVTSWATSLHEASRRTIRTCERILLFEKQYRSDLGDICSDSWGKISHFITE